MRLRPWRPADRDRVFEIANDPGVRKASFSTAAIPYETHVRWFERALSEQRPYFGIDVAGELAGYVRFDGEEITIALAPEHRGKGLAASATEAACRLHRGPVTARIRPDNEASRRSFARAGFREHGLHTDAGIEFLRMVRP